MTMNGKIYQCRLCGSLVAVLQRGAGGLSCCGAALTPCIAGRPMAREEKRAPLIDLSEVMVNGRSCWQYFPAAAGRSQASGAGERSKFIRR